MALIDTLKYLKFDELTSEQRGQLRRKLEKQKQELQDVIDALQQNIDKLKKKPTGKRSAKGRTRRHR
jgi:hypothetical protein